MPDSLLTAAARPGPVVRSAFAIAIPKQCENKMAFVFPALDAPAASLSVQAQRSPKHRLPEERRAAAGSGGAAKPERSVSHPPPGGRDDLPIPERSEESGR